MLPDEPNDEERLEELPEDYDTPFDPAGPSRDPDRDPDDIAQSEESRVDDTRPEMDNDLDLQEVYDAGYDVAAGVSEPNAGNAVVGYTPPKRADDDNEEDTPKNT